MGIVAQASASIQMAEIEIIPMSPTTIFGPADLMGAEPRSPGLHLSQIYGDIEQTVEAKKREAMPQEQLDTYRAGGFIWEHVMDRALATALAHGEWERPAEFECDGISGSPDLISVSDWIIGETKCTWKSSKGLAQLVETQSGPFWIWLVQMKGYCYMVGTNRARLFAFFVNGDYREGKKPEFRCIEFTFSNLELKENWQMIVNHARSRGWL